MPFYDALFLPYSLQKRNRTKNPQKVNAMPGSAA